jgi:threonine dehydrogenase-like Zn-dependent dehydrogenase
MSSRNATRKDFEYVIACLKNYTINPTAYITHRVVFDKVKDEFNSWLKTSDLIKAMIEME